MTTYDEPMVETASVTDVLAAIGSVDLQAPWEEVAPNLRVALPRRRDLPVPLDELPRHVYPPGIETVLGLDIGPAMLFVPHEQLATWEVSADEAFERALDNVREQVGARSQFALAHERIADVPTLAFQSRDGWASQLLLLPDELVRVMGDRNGLILAPMRDLIISLPLDVEREFASTPPAASTWRAECRRRRPASARWASASFTSRLAKEPATAASPCAPTTSRW